MAELRDLQIVDDQNSGTPANAGFPEQMAYSNVNNAARALEGILARFYKDTGGSLTTAGTGTAYTLSPNADHATNANDDRFVFLAHAENGASATLKVGNAPAHPLHDRTGSVLTAGVIGNGDLIEVVYNATGWRVISNISASASIPDRLVNQRDTSSSLKLWEGTEAQFSAIASKDATTIYLRRP